MLILNWKNLELQGDLLGLISQVTKHETKTIFADYTEVVAIGRDDKDGGKKITNLHCQN